MRIAAPRESRRVPSRPRRLQGPLLFRPARCIAPPRFPCRDPCPAGRGAASRDSLREHCGDCRRAIHNGVMRIARYKAFRTVESEASYFLQDIDRRGMPHCGRSKTTRDSSARRVEDSDLCARPRRWSVIYLAEDRPRGQSRSFSRGLSPNGAAALPLEASPPHASSSERARRVPARESGAALIRRELVLGSRSPSPQDAVDRVLDIAIELRAASRRTRRGCGPATSRPRTRYP